VWTSEKNFTTTTAGRTTTVGRTLCSIVLPHVTTRRQLYNDDVYGGYALLVASPGGGDGPPGWLLGGGWHTGESLNIFAAEFTRTPDKRSPEKAGRVR